MRLPAPNRRFPAGSFAAVAVIVAIVQPAPASAATPHVTLAPASGPAGSTVSLSGDGFRARARVQLRTGDRRLAVVRASRDGRFTASVGIRAGAAGTLQLVSRAGAQRVENRFEVSWAAGAIWTQEVAGGTGARVRWSPSRVVAPGEVLVKASGFAPRTFARVVLEGDLNRMRTDRRGRLSARIPVAAGSAGALRGTVSGRGTRLPFSVLAEPAPVAQPLVPPPIFDRTPPETVITSGPGALVRSRQATFTLSASESSRFECRLDAGGFAPCESPVHLDALPDGSHVFEARAVDGAGNRDETAARHAWTVDTAAPAAPTIALAPGGDTGRDDGDRVTRDSTLALVGATEPGAAVRVEAAPPLGTVLPTADRLVGTAVSDSSGLWSLEAAALEDGAWLLQAVVTDAAGNESPAGELEVVVDTEAPDTVLGGGPEALTNRTEATFRVDAAGEDDVEYECSLDTAAFAPCGSPARVEALGDGVHVFEARAVDRAGNRDGTPAWHSWTVDVTPPAAPVVDAPADGAAQSAADVRFAGTAEPAATVELVEGGDVRDSVRAQGTTGAWELTLSELPDGDHTFALRAVDEAGNPSPDSQAIRVRIDTTPPETTITGQPAQHAKVATAKFQFTASETGSAFRCRLDAEAFAPCQSGYTVAALADGEHTFEVQASDALGNQDPTPATSTWTVDTRPPSVAITAPRDGDLITADGAVNVTAVAGDVGTGVAEVRFYDNGVRVVTDITAPFFYRWTVSAAKAGGHRWMAKAVDRAGNATDAAPIDVDVNLVAASAETEPVPTPGDAADDPAIYVHPTDPASSAVIGTDKLGGLAVYGLDGRQLHYYDDTLPNNADIRHGIDVGGTPSAVVATSDRSDDSLRLYRVDPATRGLDDVAARRIPAGEDVYGVCLYRSSATGVLYAFTTYDDGSLRQWALSGNGDGRLDAVLTREFRVPVPPAKDGQTTEACVADDDLGRLYVSAENDAIFRFDAEPTAQVAPVAVDVTGAGGHLTADVEGLALYRTRTGEGYLLASSQGSSQLVAYGRQGSNPYVTTFAIGAGVGDIDKAAATDGIDVTAAALGDAFPNGLFVAQDGFNPLPDGTHRQNFKLVPWERIAGSMRVKLSSDPLWSPWPAG